MRKTYIENNNNRKKNKNKISWINKMWLLVSESYVMTNGMARFADVRRLLWPMACGIRGPVSSGSSPSTTRNSTARKKTNKTRDTCCYTSADKKRTQVALKFPTRGGRLHAKNAFEFWIGKNENTPYHILLYILDVRGKGVERDAWLRPTGDLLQNCTIGSGGETVLCREWK